MRSSKSVVSRLKRIEKKLERENDDCFRFPDGKGGFIEVPGNLTFIDFVAMCGGFGEDKKPDETGRNRTI